MNLIVEGLHVGVKDEGSGPVVLMLHGWQDDGRSFDSMADNLKQKFRVIRPNLPGFGGSQTPPSDWGIAEYAHFVKAYFEKMKVPSPHAIIGHSMGGRIAIYALAHKVFESPKLVLIGSAGIPQSNTPKSMSFLAIAKVGKALTFFLPSSLKQKLRSRLYETAGATDYLNAGDMKEIFSNMIKEDARRYAPRVKSQTLLIYGKDDTQAPPSFGKKFSGLIPKSQLYVIPNAGHFPHHDQRHLVERKIADFI